MGFRHPGGHRTQRRNSVNDFRGRGRLGERWRIRSATAVFASIVTGAVFASAAAATWWYYYHYHPTWVRLIYLVDRHATDEFATDEFATGTQKTLGSGKIKRLLISMYSKRRLVLLGKLVAVFAVTLWSPAVGSTTNIDPTASSLNSTIFMPIVDIVDELPVIQAYINGKGPFRFKFDSGSVERIDKATASALGLSISGRSYINEIAGLIPATTSSVDLRVAGGKAFQTTMFVTLDGWHDSPTINGYLGTGLLDHYTVTLDMPHRRMILSPPGDYKPPGGSTVLPMSRIDGYAFAVPARIDGLYGTFMIDTGARGGDVLLSAEFQQSPGFKSDYSSNGQAGQAAGPAGKRIPIMILTGRVLEIGDQQIARPDMALVNRDDFAVLHDVSGVIGLHVLQQFEITFDAAGSRFVLSNRQPSNVLHRGIGFDTECSAGATWIRRVVRGSSAWAAGLRDGDRLLEVDHEPIDHVSSKAWGTLWQETDGAVVNLVAQRGTSAPRRLNIVLKSWKEQF